MYVTKVMSKTVTKEIESKMFQNFSPSFLQGDNKSTQGNDWELAVIMNFDKFLILSGLLLLFHAAYSAAQHRSYLRLTEQEFTSLPADILLQTVLSLFVSLVGVVRSLGNFKDIKASSEGEKKSWENIENRTSFYHFNHRGKRLFGDGASRG